MEDLKTKIIEFEVYNTRQSESIDEIFKKIKTIKNEIINIKVEIIPEYFEENNYSLLRTNNDFVLLDEYGIDIFEEFIDYSQKYSYLDVSNWDISNVTDMSHLFEDCESLIEIKGLETWNTSKVINMSHMFSGCVALEYLDLSKWDTSKVINMSGMFYGCKNLKEIKGIEYWDTSNVTMMKNMFSECYLLENVDFSYWDFSKVNDTD